MTNTTMIMFSTQYKGSNEMQAGPEFATMIVERAVSRNVFNPCKALFKQPRNARAKCTTVWCKLESCILRDAGSCAILGGLFGVSCPYGRLSRETGPTPRAQKFSAWLRERKEAYKDTPCLGYPATKLAFIGEWVYLPYAHMDMKKSLEFTGTMLHKKDWTICAVLQLIDFRPQPLFGWGEIASYQQKHVPLFLTHLREVDPEMWAQVIASRPELDTAPDHVGRKALVKTLAHPISWTTKHAKYPVHWKWDGEQLTTKSPDVYSNTWGGVKLAEFTLVGVPADDAVVKVQTNDWVTGDTIFVD